MTINPLTREQKLLAEIIVQLGNVSEAIRQASQGENSGELASQVGSLQSELTALTADNASLAQQLADSNLMVSQLQQQLQVNLAHDITPDSVNEVIQHLGIEVAQ